MPQVGRLRKDKGVKGWLLILCIWLTILIPGKSIYYLIYNYLRYWPHFETYPGTVAPTVIYTALTLGVIGLSVYTGIALWSVRSGAVSTAKKFLFIFAGFSLVDIIFLMLFPMFAGLPFQSFVKTAMPVALKETLKSILFPAICYAYLRRSKRVKATYRNHAPNGQEGDSEPLKLNEP
jgi:hypothetical protein